MLCSPSFFDYFVEKQMLQEYDAMETLIDLVVDG